MKIGIRKKTMLLYGGALLTVISIAFFLSYKGTIGGLKRQLTETNMALLNQIDQMVEMVFQQTDGNLVQLMDELELVYYMNDSYKDEAHKNGNFFSLNNKLSKFMNQNKKFSSVFVYSGVSGNTLTETAYIKNTQQNQWLKDYLGMEDYFQWLTTHKVTDGEVRKDVVTLIRSYPALSVPGYRKGLIAVNIDEDVLHQMIRGIFENNHKGHIFLIDNNGQVVTHDDKTMLYSNMRELPYIQRVLAEGDRGSFTAEFDNIQQAITFKTSAYTGWKIVSVVPERQMYRPLTAVRNILVVLAACMFLLMIASLLHFNRWSFKPIERLIGKLPGAYKPDEELRGAVHAVQGVSYLENIFDQIFRDRETMEQQLRDSKPILKWRTVMDILTGYRTEFALVRHHLEYTGVRLYPERFIVCTAEISKEGGIQARDQSLYTYALCNVAEEIINVEHSGTAIDLGNCRAVILFSFLDGDGVQNPLRAGVILDHILEVMNRQFGLHVTVGVGRYCKEMKDIPLSFGESGQALEYKMIMGVQSVIFIEELQASENRDYSRLARVIDRILGELKQTEMARMTELVREMFREALTLNFSPELIRQFSFNLVVRAMQTTEAIGIRMEEMKESFGNVYERIRQCTDWRQTEELVTALLGDMVAMIGKNRNQRGKNDTIEKILAYIHEHYQDSSLSLDLLAEQFHLNSTYISKLFKDYTEGNFIDYLIRIRLETAKELLKDKSFRVSDIAEAVGYTNIRGFLRIFKKYTGLTPTEYRERFLEQD